MVSLSHSEHVGAEAICEAVRGPVCSFFQPGRPVSSPLPSLHPKLGDSFLACLALALVLFCLGLHRSKNAPCPSNLCFFSGSSKDVECLKHDNWEASLLCSLPSPEATSKVSSDRMCVWWWWGAWGGRGGGAEGEGEILKLTPR